MSLVIFEREGDEPQKPKNVLLYPMQFTVSYIGIYTVLCKSSHYPM